MCYAGLLHGVIIAEQLVLYLCMISQSESILSQEFFVNSNFFRRESFSNLSKWLADARALASPHLVVVLVGSKSDREEDREVEWAEASKWAAENGGLWIKLRQLKSVYIA